MIVSEAHRQLIHEWYRLRERLNDLSRPDVSLPSDHGFLDLVPALHAIVDRLEKLEQSHVGSMVVDVPNYREQSGSGVSLPGQEQTKERNAVIASHISAGAMRPLSEWANRDLLAEGPYFPTLVWQEICARANTRAAEEESRV